MPEAIFVSTARSPIGRAYRGCFSNTRPRWLAAHVLGHTAERAGAAAGEIDVIVRGTAMQQGSTACNIARQAAPDTYRGMAVAGCEPDETGTGPVLVIPEVPEQHNLPADTAGVPGT